MVFHLHSVNYRCLTVCEFRCAAGHPPTRFSRQSPGAAWADKASDACLSLRHPFLHPGPYHRPSSACFVLSQPQQAVRTVAAHHRGLVPGRPQYVPGQQPVLPAALRSNPRECEWYIAHAPNFHYTIVCSSSAFVDTTQAPARMHGSCWCRQPSSPSWGCCWASRSRARP